jgi:branched-chain amino acid transport system ATP-binding protein
VALLEIRDLVVHYGKINALKSVSLSIDEGAIVTLIGANGAGKTSLLNTISGVVHPSAGAIVFRGENIAGWKPEQVVRRGIAQVPEGRKIFSELTVEENMAAGAYTLSDKARVKALMERNFELFPRLAERRRQDGGTLSGGEQQMLAIARGLMCDPALLLLDEPSLGIAPILVEKIFEFIETINRMGKTILLVEQNANIALHVAAYGYVLETGRVAHHAACRELLENDAIRRAYLGIT